MTVVFVKKRSFLDFAEQNINIFSANAKPYSRGGSRGRVQGVRTPPEMTCGFLIQLVFCKKKNYVIYWC